MAILGFFGALFRLVMVSELLEQSFDVSAGSRGEPREMAPLFRTFLLYPRKAQGGVRCVLEKSLRYSERSERLVITMVTVHKVGFGIET